MQRKPSPLLRHILAEPWTDDDQQTLDAFLKPALADQHLRDVCQREGPDSDAAHAAVADGTTLEERDLLEAARLAAGARYDAAGHLLASQ